MIAKVETLFTPFASFGGGLLAIVLSYTCYTEVFIQCVFAVPSKGEIVVDEVVDVKVGFPITFNFPHDGTSCYPWWIG